MQKKGISGFTIHQAQEQAPEIPSGDFRQFLRSAGGCVPPPWMISGWRMP
jgi:hypothetical protein